MYSIILVLSFASAFAWYWVLYRVRGGYATSLSLLWIAVIHLVVIYRWVNAKHICKADVGLRVGSWNPVVSWASGIGVGVLLFSLAPIFLHSSGPRFHQFTVYWFKWTLLSPFTVAGFTIIFALPLAEELLDRGIFFTYLKARLNFPIAVFLQAGVFSILHIGWMRGDMQTIPYHFVAGCIFGVLYHKSGSLYPSLVAHGTVNFLSLSAMLAQ